MGVVFDTFEPEKQLVGPSMRSSVCYSMDAQAILSGARKVPSNS